MHREGALHVRTQLRTQVQRTRSVHRTYPASPFQTVSRTPVACPSCVEHYWGESLAGLTITAVPGGKSNSNRGAKKPIANCPA
jgi:hypothetical protein